MSSIDTNIFSRIKQYRDLSQDIQKVLRKSPADAPKYQGTFNSTVDRLYQDIMDFEKEQIKKSESDVYRLKKIYDKRYRQYFLYGDYIRWCAEKPFGYSGDFKIIDDIYQNQVLTTGFDYLWDSWFQQLAASRGVRQRKEDFKKIIHGFFSTKHTEDLRCMNLACGSAREIKDLLDDDVNKIFAGVNFDCYDFDIRALNYAQELIGRVPNVNFIQKNAIRLALKKNIRDEVSQQYDLIYCTGLFDYLDKKIAYRLVSNLRCLLSAGGIIVISSASDKYSNTSSMWMEWIGEWYLIYRTADEFSEIFLNAGLRKSDLTIVQQQNKVFQYCIVKE